jgi:anaerobic magnesium-protoporphyrin IX monomethyl ester cyclase
MEKGCSDATLQRLAQLPLPEEAKPSSTIHFGLVVPPSPFVVPTGWEWVHTAPFEGPSIIAGLLKGLGYRFTLLDQREIVDPEDLRGKLSDFDIIGFSTFGDSYNYLRRAIEIAKEERPEIPVVLGGPLITSAPRLIMESTRADYAVVGEGELTLTELMDHFAKNPFAKPLEKITGLMWKRPDGVVIANSTRLQITNLDAIPFQDLSVWDRFKDKPIPEIYLSYSRGCIANCTFCYRAFPEVNTKSVERVRREIEHYKSYGFRMAWWNDLTFVTDKDYVHRLMDHALPAHDFRWTAFSRVTGIDVPVLKHMRDRGLDLVLYGMESVSREVLTNYHKGTSRNAIVNAIYTSREAGIKIGGLFIIGAPHDNKRTAQELIEFCEEFKEVTRVKYLSAIPGTQDYRNFVKSGKIGNELAHLDWLSRERSIEEDIDQEGFVIFTDHLTKEELRQIYRRVNNTIERRPYDYMNPQNEFLSEPTAKFKSRPEIPVRGDV